MGATPFVILLPPSEGKSQGGNARTPWSGDSGIFGPALGVYRTEVVHALRHARGGDQKLLGVKGIHLEHAQKCNISLAGAPTVPAWQRYTGVVWDHLDLISFPTATRNAALRRLFVPSGLAGIVRADDPLPDYRLKMGARLSPFGLMSSWWCDDLTDALNSAVSGAVIVDLLPQEHKAALQWDSLGTVVHVDLISKKGTIVGGHNAKAAKGLLVRHLLLGQKASLSSLISSFSHPEYSAKESQ